jgi:hypothetical protein
MKRPTLLLLCCLAVPAAAQTVKTNCTDVQVGTARSYECLNQQLGAVAHQAQRANGALDTPPYTATSPGNQTGQFNEAATRERLGTNFGKSVTPARQPTVYGNPVTTPHP